MAYCPYCGCYWIIRSGRHVRSAISATSPSDDVTIPDIPCPECERHAPVA